jgi:hypothetical protein
VADILPARIGLDPSGSGKRWGVADLLKRRRAHADANGESNPTPARCIAAGLFAAARINPLDPMSLSEADARVLVRLALFDLGPASTRDEAVRQMIIERLLSEIERHVSDDTDGFDRWFFKNRDDLIHQIAKQKKRGGEISREVVRRVFLDLVFESYSYVGDCVCLQMQAFAKALPIPLEHGERELFEETYFKRPWLGGLPLILIRERFEFLRDSILEILEAPGGTNRIAVLLRLLEFYGEMTSNRREVDRSYKKRGYHRNTRGRIARTVPLLDEPPSVPSETTSRLFQKIVDRLLEDRPSRCKCDRVGHRKACLLEHDTDVIIGLKCDECDSVERIEVPRSEFDRIAHEVGSAGLSAGTQGRDTQPES